jgi:hypothetical protein
MKSSVSVLQKIFAREFYRANTSLFLIILGLGVGFMKGEDHVMLAEIIVGAPFLTLIPFTVWFVYSIFVVDFNHRTTARQENEFAFHYILFGPAKQWRLACSVVVLQFLPALAYGIFLMLVGVKFSMWFSTSLLAGSLVSLFILVSIRLRHALRHPGKEDKISRVSRQITRNVTRPSFTFTLEGLLRSQPFSILGCKAAGFALMWASLALYTTETYDFRLLGLGIALGISLNAGTISQWHSFENVSFRISRSLPLTLMKRSLLLLSSLTLFLLPEAGLLVANFPPALSLPEGLGSLLFAISIPYVAYSFMFTKGGAPERIGNIHFFATLVWVVLILSGTPLIVLALINFGFGAYCWKRSYYSYESIVTPEDPEQ